MQAAHERAQQNACCCGGASMYPYSLVYISCKRTPKEKTSVALVMMPAEGSRVYSYHFRVQEQKQCVTGADASWS